jgi:hypothetical protein
MLKTKLAITLPSSDDEFTQMMETVDEALRNGGVQIAARSLEACRIVSWSLGLGLSLFPPKRAPSPGVFVDADLVLRIMAWIDARYGRRQIVDFGPGLVAIALRGDLWSVRLPRQFGTAFFFASRTERSTTPDYYLPRRELPRLNVLDQVLELPEGLRSVLSDSELAEFLQRFMAAFKAMSALENVVDRPMVFEARGDLGAAHQFLMSRPQQLGQARYSAMQASEKLIKCCIDARGENFKRIHSISKLHDAAVRLGLSPIDPTWIAAIECTADPRYGQEKSTADQAYRAYWLSLMTCGHVAEQVGPRQNP